MKGLSCTICGKSLTGGTDTFGDIGVEMCQEDWFEIMAEWDTFVGLQNLISAEERREAIRMQFQTNKGGRE